MLRDRMLYEKKHNIKYVVVNIKHIGPWELEIIMQKYVSLHEEMWLWIVFKCLYYCGPLLKITGI